MPELANNQFEIVGDAEALPDAFFDALAALLLATHEAGDSSSASDTAPITEEICS